MNEPPISRYLACGRSGQPSVWMMRSSGCATCHTSFTPSSHTCGAFAVQPEVVERHVGEVRRGAFGEHRDAGDDVVARLEVAELLAVAPAAAVAGANADDRVAVDEQPIRGGLGQHHGATRFGQLGEPAPQLRHRDDDIAVVAHRRRRRHRERAVAREEVDRLAGHRAVASACRRARPRPATWSATAD